MAKGKLTEKQRAFTRFYAVGDSQREAYRKAYGGKRLKESTCDANASKLLRNTKVQEYLAELRKKAESDAVLSRQKRMEWLSRVVTTAPDKVDGQSDVCQEMVTSEFGIKCRLPDKIRAVQELNKMDGAYAPEEVKVTTELSFGSLLKNLKSSELVKKGKEGEGIGSAGEGGKGRNGVE